MSVSESAAVAVSDESATERPIRSPNRRRLVRMGRGRSCRVPADRVPAEWVSDAVSEERPRTRAECPASRPCPWVGCRYHLALDVSDRGALILTDPGTPPWEMRETCALDVAERGGIILAEVGRLMNVSSERIRQIEREALNKLRGLAPLEDGDDW